MDNIITIRKTAANGSYAAFGAESDCYTEQLGMNRGLQIENNGG